MCGAADTLNHMQMYITNTQTSHLLKQRIYALYYILMTHVLTINHCLAQTIETQTQGKAEIITIRVDCSADSASSAHCLRAHQLQSSQVTFCQQYIFTLFFLVQQKKDELAKTKTIEVFIRFA